MIGAIVAGVVSTLLAPRIERAWQARRQRPHRRPNLDWTTQPWRRLR